jgi:hypothetical protein
MWIHSAGAQVAASAAILKHSTLDGCTLSVWYVVHFLIGALGQDLALIKM